jgi:hypothetical protein
VLKILGRHIPVVAVVISAILLGAAGAVALARANGGGSDDAAKHAVDFTKVTPVPPLTGTRTVPDYSNPSHCQFPEDERPSPDLPPLSCRNTGAEPSPGAIPTLDPKQAPTPALAQAGHKIIDNPLFRLTVEVPDTWFSTMRPEGGAFDVFDPIETEHEAKHTNGPLGVALGFSAGQYVASAAKGLGHVETALESPNTTIAGAPAVIIDEGTAEGSRWLTAAFRRGNVLYRIDAFVAYLGRSDDDVEADIDIVKTVLASITTY